MAKSRVSLLWMLPFLVMLFENGMGSGVKDTAIGALQVYDHVLGSFRMTVENLATFADGTQRQDAGPTFLLNGHVAAFDVLQGTVLIQSSFTQQNGTGSYHQAFSTWAIKSDHCGPNCFWYVDEEGFSVGNQRNGDHLKFIVGWNGPVTANLSL